MNNVFSSEGMVQLLYIICYDVALFYDVFKPQIGSLFTVSITFSINT